MCSNKTSQTFGAVTRRGKIEFSSTSGALKARDHTELPQCGPQLGVYFPPLAPFTGADGDMADAKIINQRGSRRGARQRKLKHVLSWLCLDRNRQMHKDNFHTRKFMYFPSFRAWKLVRVLSNNDKRYFILRELQFGKLYYKHTRTVYTITTLF